MSNFFKKTLKIIDRIASVIEWQIHKTYRIVHKKKTAQKHFLRDTILILLAIVIFFMSGFLLWATTLKTPDLNSFDNRLLGQSAKIYDKTGKVLLYDLSQKVRRTVVPFEEISAYVKKATIAIEDIDFYTHKGIKPTSIFRAVLANLTSLRFSQGGSTITQQVVKNSLLTKDKDISRKLKEWILAVKLERNTTKDTILNLYLNDTPYGGNIYGVEEASQAFFAKKSSDVTLAEAAYLAALPQAPSLYSPYGKNIQSLVDRKNLVLKKMYENKMISEEEYSTALKENVVFQPKTVGGIKAPHFVMYVKDYLEQKYGDQMLAEGGFTVITTLDWEMQQKAEEIVGRYVKENQKKYNASNGSLVAIDPKTGGILAMVGSRDYFDKEIDGNFNTAISRRQPGSSFKPFVYATAFNKGFTPETPIYDVPTEFNSSCTTDGKPISGDAKCYSPQNYEGGYKGLMSLRKALAESRNIPAVRLLHLVGVDDSIKTAEAMGVQNLSSAEQYGLSLALGGGEVSVLDMTSAYGVFANNGERQKATGILEIKTSEGVEIEKIKNDPKQVIPQQTAQLMNDVLSDPYARASIFGSRYFGDRQVSIKTGTTNSSRDAWIIGYTPSISVGSWMGNNNNTPMVQQASARIIGPMWKEFMDWALTKIPEETFEPAQTALGDLKPFLKGVWQGPGTEVHSELYWINKSDPTGTPPGYSSKDSLFRNFESGVQNWALNQGTAFVSNQNISSQGAGFRVTSPLPNSSVAKNERVTVVVDGTNSQTTQVEYYVNGILIGKSTDSPFSFSFIPSATQGIDPENELKAVMIDKIGKYTEFKVFFSVTQ